MVGQIFLRISNALSIAICARFGSMLFSNLCTASVRSPSAVDVFLTDTASNVAASKIIVFVCSLIPENSPPITPAIAIGFS